MIELAMKKKVTLPFCLSPPPPSPSLSFYRLCVYEYDPCKPVQQTERFFLSLLPHSPTRAYVLGSFSLCVFCLLFKCRTVLVSARTNSKTRLGFCHVDMSGLCIDVSCVCVCTVVSASTYRKTLFLLDTFTPPPSPPLPLSRPTLSLLLSVSALSLSPSSALCLYLPPTPPYGRFVASVIMLGARLDACTQYIVHNIMYIYCQF